MRNLLLDELRFVAEEMKKSKEPFRKMYFFSAAYAAANRIINIEFDDELSFIHNVLSSAYSTINVRLSALSSGSEMAVGIPERTFDRLQQGLEEIIGLIEAEKETYPALQKISNVAYGTTGNGYYLYLKGQLKI
ncbi:MAG: hypothetical protein WC551_09915 [Patescibacteria group bacterium]